MGMNIQKAWSLVRFAKPTSGSCIWSRSMSKATSSDLETVLISRAKALSHEYQDLLKMAEQDRDFSTETANRQRRLADLSTVHETFARWQGIKENSEELARIIACTQDPDMRALAQEELSTSAEDIASCTEQMMKVLTPKHPQGHLPALLEIRSGVGGDEANIFANDLLKMYEKYATTMRWQLRTYSVSRTEIGDGVTEAIIAISGPDAFGKLRGEAGVHRVQRTPATESKGRTHTSTVSINVLPEIDDSCEESEFEKIDLSEVKLEVMRSRGAGGQHVNRTESAVRLTHIPTGLTISMQDSRSQHANKRAAFAILRSKLSALRREKAAAVQVGLRRSQVTSADRSEKIRTYNYAQSRVTDHRCGYTSHDLEGIMSGAGSLDIMMEEVNQWFANVELQRLVENDTQNLSSDFAAQAESSAA